MRKIIKLGVAGTAAAALTVALASGPVGAEHSHHLSTPGTCIEGLGAGQPHAPGKTWQPGQGKFFHSGLHVGVPGEFAFARGGNVSIHPGNCPAR